jgi:hypothetical protein
MPKVAEAQRGTVAHNGRHFGLAGGMGRLDARISLVRSTDRTGWASEGLARLQTRHFADLYARVSSAAIKIAMAVGEVLYGILGAAFRLQDPEIVETVVRIYNDFAADFSRACPERLATIAMFAYLSPGKAADELKALR